jgi:hypothetical protein
MSKAFKNGPEGIHSLQEAHGPKSTRVPQDTSCVAVQMKQAQQTMSASRMATQGQRSLMWSCLAISYNSEVLGMANSGSKSILGASVRHNTVQAASQASAAAQEIRVSLERIPRNVFCLAFMLTSYPCRSLESMGRIFLRSVCYSGHPSSKSEVLDAFISNQMSNDDSTCAVPYLIFRTSTGSWNSKPTGIKCRGSTLLEQLAEVLLKIQQIGIAPFDYINIEHARQPRVSGMTTWHVPGTYETCAAKVSLRLFP